MKIGFDAKRLFNNFTGLGNYSRFVVDALADHFSGHDYLLYTPRLKDHPETRSYRNDPRFAIRQPTGWGLNFPSWWRTVSLGRVAAREGVQVFHGLSNELPLTKPPGLRTVLTVHDLIFKRFPNYYNPVDVQIYAWKLKKACASADGIVAVSQQTAADLHEFLGVPADKIRVICQGCHPNFKRMATAREKETVNKKYQLPANFILFVGTLEERKNAVQLVKALALMREKIPLVLVGRETPYVKKVKAVISELHLEHQVQVLHGVSFQELPVLYQLASVFAYPSVFEGFGIPIVEAIVSGVPVLTSHGSCFDEAGGPATRYANPSQPAELASHLDEILSSRDLRQEMISRSKEYVKRFEPEVISRQLMEQYQALG